MKRSQLVLQTVFAFILFMMPTIALEPQDDSIYTVSDFFAYYTQARMLVSSPRTDVYSVKPLMAAANAMYPLPKDHLYLVGEPPLSLTFLLPLSLIPPAYSLWVYKTFLVLCASISVALLSEIFELNERQYQLTTILVAISGPLWESTRVSKPGLIVLLGLTLSLWALKHNKSLPAALYFLPWTFKPQLMAPFVCAMLGDRKFKFVIFLAAATLLLALVTLPIFGMTNYQAWWEILKFGTSHPELNSPSLHPTLRGQLMRFATIPTSFVQTTSTLAFVAAQIVALVVGLRLNKRPELLLWCTLVMPLGILCSPYCHNYDLVLLIPSIVAFFKLPGLKSLTKPLRIGCLSVVFLCLLVFEMPIYTLVHYTYLQHSIWTVSPLFCSLLIMSVLFVIMALRESTLVPQTAASATNQDQVGKT